MNTRMIEWVKVEERLPEDKRLILVYCSKSDPHLFFENNITSAIFYSKHKEFCSLEEYYSRVLHVTHWAYFPDPPNDIDL